MGLYTTIFKETLKGKNLTRILQNRSFQEIQLSGKGIDLGAKSNSASYYRFLQVGDTVDIQYTDLNPSSEDILQVDLEKHIPVEDDSQDFLILNNVLEHLFEYQSCVDECYRVLNSGGELIGVVPFLYKVHPDPDDFFRYTESSLQKIFKRAGFTEVAIAPLGFGPFSAGVTQFERIIRPRFLLAVSYVIAVSIDRFLSRYAARFPSVRADRYPLSYLFVCSD